MRLLAFTIRRLIWAVPSLLLISIIIFSILNFAPSDPLANQPLTIPAEVRQKMREALGLGEPAYVRYWKWLTQFFWIEPLNLADSLFGTSFAENKLRVVSWQFRSPVVDIIVQRLPQTLWVVGVAYLLGVAIAVPIGVISAYRKYSVFDQVGTFVTMIGFSIPPFFSGVLAIVIFSIYLGWFPSIYDTTLVVRDWATFKIQLQQMFLPVMVLALQVTSQISRFMRASTIDSLSEDYVVTARSKGLKEIRVVTAHVVRNSLIPVVTVVALGAPAVFGGAIITEQIFKVNGIGHLLISSIEANDMPMVQTLVFIFALLIVLFNLLADILYALLDPRIRYD